MLERLDQVAVDMESKWGVDRLPRLVSPDMAKKFYGQRDKLNEHIETGGNVTRHAEAMIRAWQALDAEATRIGAKPMDPKIIEARHGDHVIAITQTDYDAHFAAGRYVEVWAADEVARIITTSAEVVSAIKQTFPGATVTASRTHEAPPFVEHMDEGML